MGSKNASGDSVYHVIARENNIQLLLYAASVTKDAIHVIAANAKGQSPLHVALEGQGSADRLAVALELVNTSGAFATGAPRPLNMKSESTLFFLYHLRHSCSSHAAVFEKLRAKNHKTYVTFLPCTFRVRPLAGGCIYTAQTTMATRHCM
jgi:hypothetical protein